MDIYGLSEVMGPGVAQECVETKDGPTLWEDHFYPEVIDPDSGEVLPEGSFGELVPTALTKRGQPVIRYRTRDLTRLLPGTARTMRRIQRVTGRSDDMLIVRGVNVFPSQIEAQVLKVDGLSPHFQIEVDRAANLVALTVRVERDPAGWRPPEDLAASLGAHIKANIGVSVEVEVAEPGAVPRSQGKAQRVVSAD